MSQIFNMITFIFKEASRSIKNAPLHFIFSLLLMISCLSLTLGGITLYLVSQNITEKINNRFTISIFLKSGLSDAQVKNLKTALVGKSFLTGIKFISKSEAEQKFFRETGEDFRRVLDYNPLPVSFLAVLRSVPDRREKIDNWIKEIKTLDGVDDVLFESGFLLDLIAMIKKIEVFLWIITGVFLVFALYVTYSFSSLLIRSRKEEIKTMKLVGAKKFIIVSPVLINGVLVGLLGAVISVICWALLISYIPVSFDWLNDFYIPQYFYALVVFSGITLGFLSGFFASRKV